MGSVGSKILFAHSAMIFLYLKLHNFIGALFQRKTSLYWSRQSELIMNLWSQNSWQNPFIQNTRVPDVQHFTNPCGMMGFSNSLIVQSSMASESGDSASLSPEQRQAQPVLCRANLTQLWLQIVIFILGNAKADVRRCSPFRVFYRKKILE